MITRDGCGKMDESRPAGEGKAEADLPCRAAKSGDPHSCPRAAALKISAACFHAMVAPNIEFFHIDKAIPGSPSAPLPDVTGYALRDYGSRIGVFRMMDVLDMSNALIASNAQNTPDARVAWDVVPHC